MLRCASANLRLSSSFYKRQTLLAPSKLTISLLRPNFRHSFSTTRIAREEVKEQVKEQAATKAKKSDPKEIRRLFKLAKPEMKNLTAATGLLVISSAVSMSVPFSMGKIIDIVTNPSMDGYLGLTMTEFAGALSLVFVLGAAANTGRVMLFRIAGERIIQNLRNDLYKSILKQDMAFFDKNRTGELISRLSTDTAIVGKSLTNNVSDGLRALATATVGSSMMLFVSPKLTGIMMLIIPPVAIFGIVYGRYVKKLSKQTQVAISEITKVAEERISSIRTVQAFAKEHTEEKRYANRVEQVFALAKKEAIASGLFFGGAGLSGNLAVLAVLGYGGKMVMENIITIGELTSFMLYTAYVGTALGGMTSFYSEIMKGVGASDRIFELLHRQSPIALESGKVLNGIEGKIKFDGINFAYPTRPQSQIFKDFSLTVNPGTVIAVVGSSGSGKSTIGSLLLRYYDPLAGNIYIDGNNIKDVNLRWWREQVGVVSQEPTLFAGTIRENIAYGRENATLEEIEDAAAKANCASFINTFADKYDTLVGERGVSLSGGQKQRIAIARALLKNPKVLILDEATSALDSESEVLVQDALNRLMHGRTVFTIAHRLSTIRSADLVACLSDGGVAELGTYYELVNRENGVFRKLVELQSLGGAKDEQELEK